MKKLVVTAFLISAILAISPCSRNLNHSELRSLIQEKTGILLTEPANKDASSINEISFRGESSEEYSMTLTDIDYQMFLNTVIRLPWRDIDHSYALEIIPKDPIRDPVAYFFYLDKSSKTLIIKISRN